MPALNRSTRRRLQSLPQIPSVWEGDRRLLSKPLEDPLDPDAEAQGECILWVDGSEGIVRAMDVVQPEIGQEAIVRTLLRAIENPQGASQPARPQKIVVKDRELQFFLRGVLQELDIAIDYVPELPLIDELFRGFQEAANARRPRLPPQYADLLKKKAGEIWKEGMWRLLADHQIIAIELQKWDVGTLYVSVMGMLGMEYGVLLYRSLESLKRFRAAVVAKDSFEEMEEAFLGQDCLFVTFQLGDNSLGIDEDDDEIDLASLPASIIQAGFGNVHPLEGMRPFLYEEEALIVYVALEALQKFFRSIKRQLAGDEFPAASKRFRITLPKLAAEPSPAQVEVSTLPEVAAELFALVEDEDDDDDDYYDDDDDDDDDSVPLRDDLVPKNSFLTLGMMPWQTLEALRKSVECYQPQEIKTEGEGLPIILIQTSRPKAKALIQQIQLEGGLKGIGFNPGENPFDGDRYDLGILQTEDGNLHLFGEFLQDEPIHHAARQKWDRRCKKTKGYCALIIAKGLTGASRGDPTLNDMMALFETRSLPMKDLALGVLQLMPQFE